MASHFQLIVISLFIAISSGPSIAETELRVTWLNEEEISNHLLGKHFSGVLSRTWHHFDWSECIETTGRTVYSSSSTFEQIGQLTTKDPGQACFKYAQEENCFHVGVYENEIYVFRPLSGRMAEFGIDFWALRKSLASERCETRRSVREK
jgi:hypothetical protein